MEWLTCDTCKPSPLAVWIVSLVGYGDASDKLFRSVVMWLVALESVSQTYEVTWEVDGWDDVLSTVCIAGIKGYWDWNCDNEFYDCWVGTWYDEKCGGCVFFKIGNYRKGNKSRR